MEILNLGVARHLNTSKNLGWELKGWELRVAILMCLEKAEQQAF